MLRPLATRGGPGRPSYPALAMFKAMLLAQWYQLSDPALEEALADRISFRRFCGFALDAVTPDDLKKQRDRLKRAAKKTPLLVSGASGQGVREALQALVEVIGEAPVSAKAKGAAAAEPWTPTATQQG